MMYLKKTLPLLFLALVSCTKYEVKNEQQDSIQKGSTADLVAPDNFSYETTSMIPIRVLVKDNKGKPLALKSVSVFSKDPDQGGRLLGKGFTDNEGLLNTFVRVPNYLSEVFIQVGFVGFANNREVSVSKQGIQANFGGASANSKRYGSGAALSNLKSGNTKTRIGSSNYFYMGTFNSLGVPDYLENPGDNISTELLNDINSALPSGQSNAAQIAADGTSDAKIIAPAEVWVTFISEGAGFKNSLAYYVYDTDNPPSSPSEIDSIFVIFPNGSLLNSGGGLQAGDKVCLGTFPAGVSLGWVLLQNAYKDGVVRTNLTKIYSTADFNPEADPALRPHNLQLLDPNRDLVVVGFEDQLRDNPKVDNDFNDCIFYVTATPFSSLDNSGTYTLVDCDDSDGDGVDDCTDQYPNDPNKVADSEYLGTLSYEDLWPYLGDYDFNDMVIDYDLTQTLNANNKVVSVNGTFTLKAIGAGFNNGFGLQLDNVSNGAIGSFSISSKGNSIGGQETSNAFATFVLFDNAKTHMVPTSAFVNTVVGAPYVNPVSFDVSINFSSPQDLTDIGFPPYNPFIFVNKPNEGFSRGREVHLPDFIPTSKANQNLFGVGNDDTNEGTGKYYKTETNLPWGLHIEGGGFDYPRSAVDIRNAYPNFQSWVESGGQLNPDWYLDINGNRVSSNIYTHPQ
ncbi:MAG: LruC domain-containing protein [Luteibaculum sp.]